MAQRLLSIDLALPEMAARRVEELAPPARSGSALPRPVAREEDVFRGDGQLGTGERFIECRWTQLGYSLDVDGVGRFRITGDGRQISRNDGVAPAEAPTEFLTETVLGPAMTLALALQDVWCLHASAVEFGGEVVAILGRSGAGKSTLGRELPRIDPRLRCAADDVLPVTLDGGAAHALPQFPQLKYRLDRQPGDALPPSLPLRRIYVLEPLHDLAAELSTEPLTGADAVLALVRHTVAAKLFTKDLLKHHMDACVHIAGRVEVSRLCYPHRPEILGHAHEILFPQTA